MISRKEIVLNLKHNIKIRISNLIRDNAKYLQCMWENYQNELAKGYLK